MRGFKFLLGLIAFCLFALALPTNSTAHPWDGGSGVTLIADQQLNTDFQSCVWNVLEMSIQNQTVLQNYVASPVLIMVSDYAMNVSSAPLSILWSDVKICRVNSTGAMNKPLMPRESVGIIKGSLTSPSGRNVTNI